MKFVVDIDDTLLYSEKYSKTKYKIHSSNYNLIRKLNNLYREGNEIILWTGRHWNDLELTIKQLKKYKIKYHTLIMGKPVADYYIDDKAVLPKKFLNMDSRFL